MLARKAANYDPIVKEIEEAGGRAVGISTDVSDSASVKNAFEKLQTEMGDTPLAAAVFNVGGSVTKKPFLEMTEEEFLAGMDANGYESMSLWLFPANGADRSMSTGRAASSSPELYSLSSSKRPTSNILPP